MAKGQRKKRAGAGWRRRFLAGLARTANARLAAEMAGVDHTSAYQLRERDPGFAAAWLRARDWGRARVAAEGRPAHPGGRPSDSRKEEALTASPVPEAPPPAPALVVRPSRREGGQVVRAGEGRWTQAAEELFLAELAATANVRAAARAADFSTTAVYARRMRDPGFAARWDEARAQGEARIDLHLIHAVDRALDPETVAAADARPAPSIAEAIQIARMFRSAGRGGGSARAGAAAPRPRAAEEARATILARIAALERHRGRERIAQGWVRDEAGNWIPPGWVRSGG
jgi:hypothetical protein